ncbi:UDP-Glycosyltransferase/glycogen phosphorylase, partial [Neoconidiobolus thromboides FSU 785]
MKTLQLSYILFLIPILIPPILTYEFNLDENQTHYNIFFASFTGSQSHVKGILNLGYELQQVGHKFSLLTTPKRMKWGNKYNITSYSIGKDESTALFSRVKKYEEKNSGEFNTDDFFAKDIDELVIKPYEYAFMELKEIVDKENPDLIICDFISVVCMDIASILKVPMIITFQSIDFGNVIINDYISLVSEYDKLSIKEMNIFDRFYHFFWVKIMKYYYYFPVISKLKAMKNKFNVPFSIATIKGNFQQGLIWANTFWGYEIPRYLPPNIQLIGPIKDALEDTKQVEEVDRFLVDKQKVIYISFGTNLILSDIEFNLIYQQLNQLIKNNLIDGVIWSLTNTKLSDKDNKKENNKKENNKSILFINYLNQPLLLNNNKIILFITHSGLESIFESIQSNTPMLNLPF